MKLVEAFDIAERLHRGQTDKAGEPYIWHCIRVMLRLPTNASSDEMMAALLHDTVEDVPGAIDALGEADVPMEVMAMVITLTRIDGETYDEFLERVRDSNARRVKLADIEDNSNEERLAKLPADLANRLRTKYANAKAQLCQG